MRSYYSRLEAKGGGTFHGCKVVKSSRFETPEMASRWTSNYLYGRVEPRLFEVQCVTCHEPPEIFRHCIAADGSRDTTTVGSKCPGCGHIATDEDAAEAGKRRKT